MSFNIRGGGFFKSEKRFNKVIQLIVDLANNTRIWENNGHAPKEVFEKAEKPYLRPLPDKPFSLRRADIFDFQTGKKVGKNGPHARMAAEKNIRDAAWGKKIWN